MHNFLLKVGWVCDVFFRPRHRYAKVCDVAGALVFPCRSAPPRVSRRTITGIFSVSCCLFLILFFSTLAFELHGDMERSVESTSTSTGKDVSLGSALLYLVLSLMSAGMSIHR